MRYSRFFSRPFLFPAVILLLLFAACKKSDSNVSSAADISNYTITAQSPQVNITSNLINVQLPETTLNGENLVASFGLSSGAHASVNGVEQVSGVTENDFGSDLNYVVTASDQTTQKIWTIRTTNNNYSYDWGLGRFIKKGRSNDRSYEWYMDQGNSGTFKLVNCGPASVTMAIKWSDSTFSGTPELARETYRSEGGWWFTTTVDSCLNDNSIPHATIPLADDAAQTQQILSRQLDSNHIIILCIDMYYISNPPANVNYHVDKFYNTAATGWGHFFVIKGYKQMDGEFYFQIYDPYSFGVTYTDASLKGRNRFYRYSDVFGASHPWWNYAIVVGKKGQTLDVNTLQHAVDPARIRHAYGGNPQVNP